jgi:hypothetical protein
MSPLFRGCGVPLQLVTATGKYRTGQPNCQFATYAMADPPSGLAPRRWLAPGDCIAFRSDGVPLTRDHIFVLWDYLCRVMDEFGDANCANSASAVFNRRSSRASLQRFLLAEWRQAKGLSF